MTEEQNSDLMLKEKALLYEQNKQLLARAKSIALDLFSQQDIVAAVNNFIEIIGDSTFLDIFFIFEYEYEFIRTRGWRWLSSHDLPKILSYAQRCAHNDPLLIYYNEYHLYDDIHYKNLFLSYIITDGSPRQFQNLSDILQKRFNLSDEIKGTVTWILLVQVCFKRYHDLWMSEYDDNPKGISDIDTYTRYCYNNSIISLGDKKARAVLTYYLVYIHEPGIKNIKSLVMGEFVNKSLAAAENDANKLGMEALLFSQRRKDEALKLISIDDVDLMTGVEFENFVADIFRRNGFTIDMTPTSGDQGVDIIASKGIQRIGIQVKRYSGNVGNAAIQEVVGGLKFYGLTKMIVVTNRYFTNSADKLAESNDVVLWDRGVLKDKIEEYNRQM